MHLDTTRARLAKAKKRVRSNAVRERQRVREVVRWIKSLTISKEERAWRIEALTGVDDRSLTGRLMGDPRYQRSALFLMRQGGMA